MAVDVSQAPSGSSPRERGFDLLAAEPDLVSGIPPEDVELAHRVLRVDELSVLPGPWNPDRPADGDGLLGFLVITGALAHDVELAGHQSMQLLGPGDVVNPFAAEEVDGDARHRWRAIEPTRLAVLDHRFVAATRKWPLTGIALHRRLSAQAARAAVLTALSQLARVELRVLAVLWHLVDRWGVVTPEGVVVDLRLTHETLGNLVGARRPTVSLALKQLADTELVGRRDDGRFVLAHDSRRALADYPSSSLRDGPPAPSA